MVKRLFLVSCWNNRSNYFSWTFPSLVPSGTLYKSLEKPVTLLGTPSCQYNGFAVTVLPQQVLLVVSHVPESSVSFQATPVYCTNKSLDFVTMRGYVHLVTPYVYHMWYTDVLMSDLINQLR